MGWGKYLLLGDLGNRLDLDAADKELKSMRSRMIRNNSRDHEQDSRILVLEQEVDEMKLMLMDLINTLVRRGGMTEQDTIEIIKRVAVFAPDGDEGEGPLIDFQDAIKD